ncbi:MAG: hypothetical protein IE909_01115 [Campylobacterales bacterium]|nr:hypothetical protein [Campylobacterales bacterium]
MIFKVLAVVAVLLLVYIVFFKRNRIKDKPNDQSQIEDIFVECPKCGTYVSKQDGILSNGKYFCSKECLKA